MVQRYKYIAIQADMENNYGEIKVVLSNKLVCSTGISAGKYEFLFAVQIPADLINREILYQQINAIT